MGNKKAPEGANKIFQADNNTISKECQLESWKKFDNAKRCRAILDGFFRLWFIVMFAFS